MRFAARRATCAHLIGRTRGRTTLLSPPRGTNLSSRTRQRIYLHIELANGTIEAQHPYEEEVVSRARVTTYAHWWRLTLISMNSRTFGVLPATSDSRGWRSFLRRWKRRKGARVAIWMLAEALRRRSKRRSPRLRSYVRPTRIERTTPRRTRHGTGRHQSSRNRSCAVRGHRSSRSAPSRVVSLETNLQPGAAQPIAAKRRRRLRELQ